jgi:hypothetical protein
MAGMTDQASPEEEVKRLRALQLKKMMDMMQQPKLGTIKKQTKNKQGIVLYLHSNISANTFIHTWAPDFCQPFQGRGG